MSAEQANEAARLLLLAFGGVCLLAGVALLTIGAWCAISGLLDFFRGDW